jgi:nitrogen fixation NifU-like protein
MAYSKKVVDKFENTLNDPKAFNVGRFDPNEENVGTGMVGAPACGDVMKLQIKCEPSGNTHVIKDVKFKTYGCGSAIASSSELVDMLIGKTLEEAKAIKNKEIVDALELPPIKIHCSRRTLKNASNIINLKNITIDLDIKQVTMDEKIISLSQKEYELLLFLIKYKNSFVSKNMIENELWSSEEFISSNVIEVTIHNLRKKLYKELIKNFRGLGYKIEV